MSIDLEGTVSVLRACLLSSKGGVSLQTLNRDYRSLVGTPIPFKQLGFRTIEDFLKSIHDIKTSVWNGELTVRAVPSEESAHIASLVDRQKGTQKKRTAVPPFGRRRPTTNQVRAPSTNFKYNPPSRDNVSITINNVNNNNNGHAYSSRSVTVKSKPLKSASPEETGSWYKRLPPRLQKKKDETYSKMTFDNREPITYDFEGDDNWCGLPESSPLEFEHNCSASAIETSATETSARNQFRGLPQRLQKKRDETFSKMTFEHREPIAYEFEGDDNVCGLPENSLTLEFKNNCNISAIEELDDFENYHSGIKKKSKKSIVSPYSPSYAIAAGRANTEAIAVKELEIKYRSNNNKENDLEVESGVKYDTHIAPWNRKPPSESFMTKLQKHCLSRGWPDPIYRIIERRPKNSPAIFGCQVKVGQGDQHFASYPEESLVPEKAKEFAAKKAYKELTEIDAVQSDDVHIVTSDINLIRDRIYDICAAYDGGTWANSIPSKYLSIYKEQLPSEWQNILSESDKFTLMNTPCEGKVIIYPSKEQSLEKEIGGDTCAELIVSPQKIIGIHTQAIPPHDENLDVFVTFIVSTEEIYVRIIGSDYSEKYDDLCNDMENYYSSEIFNLKSTTNIHIDKYYAARIIDENTNSVDWCRVSVQDINWEDSTAEVWLIDNGEFVIVSLNQIFNLAEKFTQLPKQALTCSLAHLEHHVEDDESILDLMNDLLLGKVLVAKVIERDDTVESAYSVVFYDTSGDDDVDVNECIINKKILSCEPHLPTQGVKEVYVTHIMEEGHLYVQIRNSAFNHLQKLISNLSTEILKHSLKSSSLISSKIYLARTKNGQWRRVIIKRTPPGNQVEVNFIDYGNTELVEIYNISNLEAISNVLARIPRQALHVRLHGVTIGSQELSHLRRILPDKEPVLLKVIVPNIIPEVEIFKRAAEPEGEGALISINGTVALESSQLAPKRAVNSIRRSKSITRTVAPSGLPAATDNTNTVFFKLKPPSIPDVGSGFFDVLVTTAASPSNFIVQPLQDINNLQELSNEMKSFYGTNEGDAAKWIPQTLLEGGLYAALFSNNNQWYRVTLTRLIEEKATVYSCDFGDYKMINIVDIRFLAHQFTKLPYQAIKAKLSSVVPTHTDWLVDDCFRFQGLVVDKQLVSVVTDKVPDEMNPLETVLVLQLIDTNTEEDVVVCDVLIEERRAKKCITKK